MRTGRHGHTSLLTALITATLLTTVAPTVALASPATTPSPTPTGSSTLTSPANPQSTADPDSTASPTTSDDQSSQSTAGDHAMGSQIRANEQAPAAVRGLRSSTAVTTLTGVPGLDVSSHDGTVHWASRWAAGYRFVWVKATEGHTYTNPLSTTQASGASQTGLLHGRYHFAIPSSSSGADQARYFSDNGGGWTADGRTLPGALDLEYNPYSGGDCYGLSQSQMTAWITSFDSYYAARWGRYPIIYTSRSWWDMCVGTNLAATNLLWIASYRSAPSTLPMGWQVHTVWQYSDAPFDQNQFNGSSTQLAALASVPSPAPGYPTTGPIGAKYAVARNLLGAPTAPMVNLPDGGSYQFFRNGVVTYSRATGAHEFHGAISTKWRSLGISTALSSLGYATSDGDSRVTFQKGGILNNPGRGHAYLIRGAIWSTFQSIGGVSAMGLPKSDEVNGRAGGVRRMSWFEAGAITWGIDGKTFPVRGAIYKTWTLRGSEKSRYGRPVSNEYHQGRQTRQNFSNGYVLAYQNGKVTEIRTH